MPDVRQELTLLSLTVIDDLYTDIALARHYQD